MAVSAPPAALTQVRTVCSYCGVGCGIVLDVEHDESGRRRVVKAAGDKGHSSNAGRLCTKGATTAEMLAATARRGRALARTERSQEPAPLPVEEAITRTARRLRAIIDEHGPDAVAFYVSGQMSLEAQYLSNKLAKGYVGTNQIESNSRLCMASAGSGYKLSLGADGPPGSYDDFDHADVFFVIGANMADCHPILFLRMMDRIKAAGAKLIVVDPRRTATADKADLFLSIRPGTDLALLNGLLHLLHAEGSIDQEFIAEFTEGWEAMPDFLADYPPDRVAEITGIPETDIRTAARWIADAGNWMSCWTMGLNQSTHGTWSTNALCNLHLATGAICRQGSGPFSLTGQPNAMGGREMGYMGGGLPGQRSVAVAEDRAFVEHLWNLPAGALRAEGGAGAVDLFSRMAEGHIKACWIICTNPVASMANRKKVLDGLEAAEFVVTQDVYADTETNAYADMILPAAMWAESDGVMVNSERSLTLMQLAADPPGEALPDWQLIARVACEMGYADAFRYDSAEQVFDELRQAWNPATGYDLRGVTYDRLRSGPVQWPAAPGGPDRVESRYLNDGVSQQLFTSSDGHVPRLAFPTASGRAVFHPRPHLPAAEMPDDQYPFVLNTGRLQHQWHTLTKTSKVATLNKLNSGPFVEIHPEDASAAGVAAGDSVEVASRRGRAVLPAVVSDRVRQGTCFAPFHWNDLFGEYLSINAVTNDAVDPISYQPEFKACAVSLTKIPADVRVRQAVGDPSIRTDGANLTDALISASSQTDTVDTLRGVLGLPRSSPVLSPAERIYLDGFFAALGTEYAASGVPVLPIHAPLDPDHVLWVNAALAGLFSRLPSSMPSPASDQPGGDQRRTLVIWASQTGNAELLAIRLADRISEGGGPVQLLGMDEVTAATLSTPVDLLIITSTFGDGDAPFNGEGFLDLLDAENVHLDDAHYAVLALGDSSYSDFCGFGRRIDEKLAERGATRLIGRVDCEPDYQAAADAWMAAAVGVLGSSPDGSPRARTAGEATSLTITHRQNPPLTRATSTASLVGNRLLSGAGAGKEVREFILDLAGTDVSYRVGDVLGVVVPNCPELVREWLAVAGLDAAEQVQLAGLGSLSVEEALYRHLDITTPSAGVLRILADHTGHRSLQSMLHQPDRIELDKWLWGRQTVDVISEIRPQLAAQQWADLLPQLQPRHYSIASSALSSPQHVRLVVSVVRFASPDDRPRKGVCSAYLADAPEQTPVDVFVQRTEHFRPPPDADTPMIMIGPGTGIAPFLGFLDERRALGHTGPNWLFFGEQRESSDFYYQQELSGLVEQGRLTRLDVAFSRDQRAKIYVQDRMREHGAQVWAWLRDGAHLYVCGDASRMAKDVDQVIRQIVAYQGAMSDADAAAYVKQLVADRRYVRDVY